MMDNREEGGREGGMIRGREGVSRGRNDKREGGGQ